MNPVTFSQAQHEQLRSAFSADWWRAIGEVPSMALDQMATMLSKAGLFMAFDGALDAGIPAKKAGALVALAWVDALTNASTREGVLDERAREEARPGLQQWAEALSPAQRDLALMNSFLAGQPLMSDFARALVTAGADWLEAFSGSAGHFFKDELESAHEKERMSGALDALLPATLSLMPKFENGTTLLNALLENSRQPWIRDADGFYAANILRSLSVLVGRFDSALLAQHAELAKKTLTLNQLVSATGAPDGLMLLAAGVPVAGLDVQTVHLRFNDKAVLSLAGFCAFWHNCIAQPCLSRFLDAGLDINAPARSNGSTLLDLAIENYHYSTVDFLLARGAEPSTQSTAERESSLDLLRGNLKSPVPEIARESRFALAKMQAVLAHRAATRVLDQATTVTP